MVNSLFEPIKEILYEIESLVGQEGKKKAKIRMYSERRAVNITFETDYREPQSILKKYRSSSPLTSDLKKTYIFINLMRDLISKEEIDIHPWCDEMSSKLDKTYDIWSTRSYPYQVTKSIKGGNEDLIEEKGFKWRLKINRNEIGVEISDELRDKERVHVRFPSIEESSYEDFQKNILR